MGGIGSVDWKEFEKFLLSNGCVFKRMKGDHRVYWKNGVRRPVVVPQCNPLPPFIILNNLRVIGVSKETFLTWLHE